jgi:uncharacterized membrane protein (DUF485 family)
MDRPLATGAESGSATAEELLRHPRMVELIAARRRFFRYAWTVFLASAVLLFGAAAFFPGLLATVLTTGLSLGLVLGVGYVALIFVLTVGYARRARCWDVLVDELRAAAGYHSNEPRAAAGYHADTTAPERLDGAR